MCYWQRLTHTRMPPYVVPCNVVSMHEVSLCAVSWYGIASMWLTDSASMGFWQTEGFSTRGNLSESTPASVLGS